MCMADEPAIALVELQTVAADTAAAAKAAARNTRLFIFNHYETTRRATRNPDADRLDFYCMPDST
jgi:hypothetical protein